MKEEFKEIIKKFEELNSMGYIQGINDNPINSAGLTLENYLGKKPDSLFFPDFNDIEIKCTQRFSRYNINLFSLAFDGPSLFESNVLLEKYGENDAEFNKYKKLIVNLKLNQKVLVYNKNYFELKIDYDEEKIYIKIYDIDMNYMEDRAFIYFDSLEKRILLKLNKLAIFYASKKVFDNNLFFRYYKIECYKLKDFKTFINCLETGDVKIALLLRFSRSEKDLGKNKNRNMVFSIRKNGIQNLFEKIYTYEN